MKQKFLFPLVIHFATLLVLMSIKSVAQDPLFSQYSDAPLYLNPSFAGLTKMGRVGVNYRIQGTNVSKITTRSAYLDYFVEDYQISTGLLILQDKTESSGFNFFKISLPLSYQFQINNKWIFKPALQGSYGNRRIDFTSLVFGDELDAVGNVTGNTGEIFSDRPISFFDVDIGFLTYTEKFWIGFSIFNLLQPDVSFIVGRESTLPWRISVHAGYKLPLQPPSFYSNNENFLMPTFNYTRYGESQQLDAGIIGLFKYVIVGVNFRGIPIDTSDKQALSPVVGITKQGMRAAYSFDFVLGNSANVGGIHELSMNFIFDLNPSDPPSRIKSLKCPIILDVRKR